MPIMTIHVCEGHHGDGSMRELLHQCAAHYADVLDAPVDRIRVMVTEHRAPLFFVDGDVEPDTDAPFFEFIVLQGRPQAEFDALMSGFTDRIETILGIDRSRIRGRCIVVGPEHWGIGGTMASVTRAREIEARREAADG